MSPRRGAFIDVGTNTILCLIAELRETGRFRVLDDLAEITRLGEGVDETGRIGAAGERRSLQALEYYLQQCRSLGVEEIMAVGTSALRDARNSLEVRKRWRERLGLEVCLIDGAREAAYSFLAAQRGLPAAGRELLVIDVGGGSTEFIRGNDAGMSEATSVDLGSVRLTERMLASDPVTVAEYDALAAAIDRELAPLCARWLASDAALTLVGIAGTFTTLAAVEKKLTRYSHGEVHGSRLTVDEVRRQLRLFRALTVAARKEIPGLEPKRADVILAGACLIERVMTHLRADAAIVSDHGVRYGLLYETLDRVK